MKCIEHPVRIPRYNKCYIGIMGPEAWGVVNSHIMGQELACSDSVHYVHMHTVHTVHTIVHTILEHFWSVFTVCSVRTVCIK